MNKPYFTVNVVQFLGLFAIIRSDVSKQVGSLEGCNEVNVNYVGNDISSGLSTAPSWQRCRLSCRISSRCTHWTFRISDGNCWLKTDNHVKKSENGLISGPRECKYWSFHEGVACKNGRGATNGKILEKVDLATCMDSCSDVPDCQGVVRRKSEGEGRGKCWHKHNIQLDICQTKSKKYNLYKKPPNTGSSLEISTSLLMQLVQQSGAIFLPMDEGYEDRRKLINAACTGRPAVIVVPHTEEDVSTILKAATDAALPISSYNPLTNDSIMNDCGTGSGMEEIMAASKKVFDKHAAEEVLAASRTPRSTVNKTGKGKGRGFGAPKRPYRAQSYRAQPLSPYMASFVRLNLAKLKSLEAMTADLARYSRRTSFLLCHPYNPPNYQDRAFPLWKQQAKMLTSVSLALGVGVGPDYLQSCHALGSTGWLLKSNCTMRGSLYQALLDNVGKAVAGFVVNHHLPPADAQLFNRLKEFEGGDLIGRVQVNPRTLVIEVQYAGHNRWESIVSLQVAPLAVQRLVGELPALITKPWVLPEEFNSQEVEVAPSSHQQVSTAASDANIVGGDVPDTPSRLDEDQADSPSTNTEQDQAAIVASVHVEAATPAARPDSRMATVEEM